MKNLKKVLLSMMIFVAVFAVAACSGGDIGRVHDDFIDAGYNSYEPKNYIPRNFDLDKYLGDTTSTEDDDDEESSDVISTNAALLPVDRMSLELRALILNQHDIVDEAFEDETGLTIDTTIELDTIEDLNYNVYMYGDFVEINDEDVDSKTAVIIEFPSEAYAREVLEVSQIIQDQLDGFDKEDHINGGLLLLIPEARMAFYDEIVEIFNKSEE
ncbi:MAG TPA: hypothetical protein VJ878_00250 [Candidatus Izemoplasmatales bacterium]|nr:hypothetical protein [Candidatus Izemoplasmatales bacterium]